MNVESLDPDALRIAAIGVGATLVLDAWLLVLRTFKRPTVNFMLPGRWVAHLLRGTFRHASIAKAAPVRGELALGWLEAESEPGPRSLRPKNSAAWHRLLSRRRCPTHEVAASVQNRRHCPFIKRSPRCQPTRDRQP